MIGVDLLGVGGDCQQQEGEENTSVPVLDRKLIVAKQRNGPIGDVELLFLSSYTKFENKSREES